MLKILPNGLKEYESYCVSTFILSGFPLIGEAYRVADLLFPLLELDHGFELPKLNKIHPLIPS